MEFPEQVYERSPWRTNSSFSELSHGSDEYRVMRENFVSGFNGGSISEISMIIFLPPTTIVFNMVVISYLQKVSKWFKSTRRGQMGDSSPKNLPFWAKMAHIAFDAAIVFLPQIYVGFYPHHAIGVYALILAIWAILCFLDKEALNLPFRSSIKMWYEVPGGKFHNALTGIIKTNVMVPTILYILAVDFHDFPRRFCKSTDFGLSLMDVGTGFLVILMGIVANLKAIDVKSPLVRLLNVLKTIPIVLTIAIGGFFSRWFTNHPEVVTEYGVHWNFFWTIACISILTALIPTTKLLFAQTVAVLLFHQILLNLWGTEFILHAPRDNFLSKNREGILGCIGYLGIYMCGLCLSKYLFQTHQTTSQAAQNAKNTTVNSALVKMLPFIVGLTTVFFGCIFFVQEVSRRTVNLSYIMYILAGVLYCYLIAGVGLTTLKRTQMVYPVRIITGNQFIFFMVCNLVMSVYNLSFMTTFHPNWIAIPVLYLYSVISLAITDILTQLGVKIK